MTSTNLYNRMVTPYGMIRTGTLILNEEMPTHSFNSIEGARGNEIFAGSTEIDEYKLELLQSLGYLSESKASIFDRSVTIRPWFPISYATIHVPATEYESTILFNSLWDFRCNVFDFGVDDRPINLHQITDRLISEIGRLQPGWDSDGGLPPDALTIRSVATLISLLPAETAIPDTDVDGGDGSVTMRWYGPSAGCVFSLSVRGSSVTGVFSSLDSSAGWVFDIKSDRELAKASSHALEKVANA